MYMYATAIYLPSMNLYTANIIYAPLIVYKCCRGGRLQTLKNIKLIDVTILYEEPSGTITTIIVKIGTFTVKKKKLNIGKKLPGRCFL